MVIRKEDVPAGCELNKPVVIAPRIALDGSELRQRLAIGLAHIKDLRGAKSKQARLGVFGEIVVGPLTPDHRHENHNALLALADETAELQPCVKPGNVGCVGTLAIDQQNVAPRITVKTAHHGEIELESFALAAFKRVHELGDGGFAELFGLFGGHSAPCAFLGRAAASGGSPLGLLRRDAVGLLRPIEVHDRCDTNLGDGLLHVRRFLAGRLLRVLASLDLAFNLHVRAFGERGGELAELTPDDAAVPGRLRLTVARLAILPVAGGCKRQHRERCVVAGGLHFGVFAEKSNESSSIHFAFSFFFLFPRVSRGTRKASGAAPKDKVCWFGGTAKASSRYAAAEGGGAETRRAAESGSRRPQLRRARLGR